MQFVRSSLQQRIGSLRQIKTDHAVRVGGVGTDRQNDCDTVFSRGIHRRDMNHGLFTQRIKLAGDFLLIPQLEQKIIELWLGLP